MRVVGGGKTIVEIQETFPLAKMGNSRSLKTCFVMCDTLNEAKSEMET
jgi:hypothetical protein